MQVSAAPPQITACHCQTQDECLHFNSGSSTMLSTLPYRSSSNMTLISFSGDIRKKKTEIAPQLRFNTIKWVAICRVGAGGFSEVFHVIDECSKKSLAMKWVRVERSVANRASSQSLFKTFHFESE
eukprot:204931_1